MRVKNYLLIFIFITGVGLFPSCDSNVKYKYITVEIFTEVTVRPAFNQVFSFFTLEEEVIVKIEEAYKDMTDEYLVDLLYNYYTPVPVFGIRNNEWNPQNTIEYRGNALYVRGTVDKENISSLFYTALENYKKDDLNKS